MAKGKGSGPHLGFLLLRLRAISLTQAGWFMTRLKPDWGEGRGQILQADPPPRTASTLLPSTSSIGGAMPFWSLTALGLRKFFISTHILFCGQSLVLHFKYLYLFKSQSQDSEPGTQ